MEDKESRGFAPIPERERPSVNAANAFVLLAVLGLWIASVLAGLAVRARGGAVNPIVLEGVLDAAYYLPFMVLPVALYMRRRDLFYGMRLNPLPFGSTLLLIPLAVLCVFAADVISLAWELVLERLGFVYALESPMPQNSRELTLAILFMAAVPAVCEELLMRGFVLSAWEGRGTALAVVVSSAMFALLHANIFGLPVYFALGMLAGYLVVALDSLYAGIVFHTLYNTACLAISYLLAPTEQEAQAAAEAVASGSMTAAIIAEFLVVLLLIALLLRFIQLRARLAGVQPAPRVRIPLRPLEKALLFAVVTALVVSVAVYSASTLGGGA